MLWKNCYKQGELLMNLKCFEILVSDWFWVSLIHGRKAWTCVQRHFHCHWIYRKFKRFKFQIQNEFQHWFLTALHGPYFSCGLCVPNCSRSLQWLFYKHSVFWQKEFMFWKINLNFFCTLLYPFLFIGSNCFICIIMISSLR